VTVIPYIPFDERLIGEKIRLGEQYVRGAVELLEERLPKEYYGRVAGSDIAILAVALATADEEEVIENIIGLIEWQIRR
jgi:hypothetical protein